METVAAPRRAMTAAAPLRVLVIDECSRQREEVCRRLASELGLGVKVWESEESGDALRILARQTFDVVMVDYPWPLRDGIDLLGEIMASAEDAVIVLLTGHGHPIVPADALRRGADAYLSRSELSREPLGKFLGRLIASRRMRHADPPHAIDLRALAEHLLHVERCLDQTGRRARRLNAALHHDAPETRG